MFAAHLFINEPLERVAEDWDYLQERVMRRFFTFRPVGDNILGIRRVSIEGGQRAGDSKGPSELVRTRRNLELGPKGVEQVARTPLVAHLTLSGTPHHTEHLFGYWHINDKDELIVPLPPVVEGDLGSLLIIMGTPKGDHETDRVAWYCERCLRLLFFSEYATGTLGFGGFWKWELAAVRQFNETPGLRVCPECGHENPPGYSAFPEHDTPEERAARLRGTPGPAFGLQGGAA